MSVFGVLAAGRLVQTEFQRADDTHFVINISNADSVNHVVVFLTGAQPFPENVGGAVYACWPQATEAANWYYLGFISNQKPSAIFRMARLKTSPSAAFIPSMLTTLGSQVRVSGDLQVGIAVESLNDIAAKTPVTAAGVSQQATFVEFAEKMVQNFINHVSSFVVRLPTSPAAVASVQEFVPATAIQSWYQTFQRRFQQNPDFWRDLN